MADRGVVTPYVVEQFTVPAGTTAAAPLRTTVPTGIALLLDVDVLIPAGHGGLTGFALEMAHGRILPFGSSADWVVGDGDRLHYQMDLQVGSAVDMVGYNADVYDHTFYLTVHLDLLVGDPDRIAGLIVPAG